MARFRHPQPRDDDHALAQSASTLHAIMRLMIVLCTANTEEPYA